MPRKHGSHIEVISAFVDGDEYPYEGSNVFFRGNVLYSYGLHFPMAVNVNGLFIVNGDKVSVSTTKHQSMLRQCLHNRTHFTTSFSAIQSWTRVDVPHALKNGLLQVVSYTPDKAKHKEDGFKPSEIPSGAHIETFEGKMIYYHLPASVLLSLQHVGSDSKSYALASMDENQYFVSVLPTDEKDIPTNVDEAFAMLKPDYVKSYEREHGPVPRQGEWFFLDMKLPKDMANRVYKEMKREYHLIGDNQGNSHIATRGHKKFDSDYVSGQIRHPEHKTLKLSTTKDIKIFRAIENTAITSYSAAGNVD